MNLQALINYNYYINFLTIRKDMQSTLSSKGQITIPKEIRDFLKLSKGDQLHFIIDENGDVRLQKKQLEIKDPFGKYKRPEKSKTIEEINECIKEIGSRKK